jgi:hypothetical protein
MARLKPCPSRPCTPKPLPSVHSEAPSRPCTPKPLPPVHSEASLTKLNFTGGHALSIRAHRAHPNEDRKCASLRGGRRALGCQLLDLLDRG